MLVVRALLVVAIPTGVLSSSGILSCLFPSLEPVREYGRGVCPDGRVVVDFAKLLLLGVIPGRGVPRVLCDRFLAGVGARLGGCFLNGDSGRGSDGLLGLKFGLGGRAPGPTDCANL